ncbi:hypothetical protein AAFF_G00061590 [Aldrovandia affinis]|uniref:fructose-2,6-bisphosphate 2-phosphatase n=1 Tax=Aldrovandia affinis TaxID=143900 RepID=A0AAD7RZV5_9TELE|nr:hypothetical protein AAFF_G00061590 [Aldrovandia affinis]
MLTFALTLVRHGETQYNKDKLLQVSLTFTAQCVVTARLSTRLPTCLKSGIDSPLSEIGRQQAEAAGNYLGHVKFTHAFVSNMKRAQAGQTEGGRPTADIIVKNNVHCSGMEIVCNPLLKERSFGIAEGGPVEDMKNMAKAAGQSCPDFTPPEGETPEQVKVRIVGFLESMFRRLAADHCGAGSREEPAGGGQPAGDVDEPLAGRPDDGVGDLAVHALVVSHGAYMRVVVRYLVEELRCAVPRLLKTSHLFSACPNTGICRFVFTLGRDRAGLAPTHIRCVFVNRKDHLKSGKDEQ